MKTTLTPTPTRTLPSRLRAAGTKLLRLSAGAALVLATSALSAQAQGSTSTVGADGFLRVNGQKFYPVGYYAEGFAGYAPNEYAAKTLADAGFNAMFSGDDAMSTADYTPFLNRCNELGVKNIIGMYGGINTPFINTFKGFPSVLSYEIADDGDTRFSADQIKARQNTVRAADPNHVTCSALTTGIFASTSTLRDYTGATDVSGLEWYPVYEDNGNNGSLKYTYNPLFRLDTATTRQGKSNLAIVQTFNWDIVGGNAGKGFVWPTGAQVRAMSYTALLAGAKGVLYYTLKDYTAQSTINRTQPALWNATTDFAAKMKSTLAPVVLSGAPTRLAEQGNTPYVHAGYWAYQGQQYLIVTNLNAATGSDNGQRSVSFAAGLAGTMSPLFADYPATLSKTAAGTVSGTLQPLEVQVYQITPGSTPTPTPGFGGTYRLLARHSGKALDIYGAGPDDGASAIQWAYGGGANQQWKIEATDGGYYKLTAQHSGKCLDVSGVSAADGAYVHQWAYVGGANQQWAIEPTSDGYYKLTARHSGKCLDVEGVSTADGARVQQWAYGGGANQQWAIEQVAPARLSSPARGTAQPADAALSLYPNPSPDGRATLRLTAAKAQSAAVYVRNLQGGLVGVFAVPVQAGATDWRLPSTLAKGTYFVQTTLDGKPQRFALSVE